MERNPMWRGNLVAVSILAFGLSPLIVGCGRHLTSADVPGRYSAEGDWGSSKLLLRADGTFVQDLSPASGLAGHLEGKWKLGVKEEWYGQTIDLSPFLSVWLTNLGERFSGGTFSIKGTGSHGVEILVDDDRGTTYERQ
jgi:hypothetical protein